MNLVFTLEVQDGEIRRKEHYTAMLPSDSTKEDINAKGEEILAENWSGDKDGEWRWDSYGERAARYYSYNVIPCAESFRVIQQIL